MREWADIISQFLVSTTQKKAGLAFTTAALKLANGGGKCPPWTHYTTHPTKEVPNKSNLGCQEQFHTSADTVGLGRNTAHSDTHREKSS